MDAHILLGTCWLKIIESTDAPKVQAIYRQGSVCGKVFMTSC